MVGLRFALQHWRLFPRLSLDLIDPRERALARKGWAGHCVASMSIWELARTRKWLLEKRRSGAQIVQRREQVFREQHREVGYYHDISMTVWFERAGVHEEFSTFLDGLPQRVNEMEFTDSRREVPDDVRDRLRPYNHWIIDGSVTTVISIEDCGDDELVMLRLLMP